MSPPAKRSELAEQIELARQGIDRWPGWLKDAAGIRGTDNAEASADQPSARNANKAPAVSEPED
jgi:hypothetical protein